MNARGAAAHLICELHRGLLGVAEARHYLAGDERRAVGLLALRERNRPVAIGGDDLAHFEHPFDARLERLVLDKVGARAMATREVDGVIALKPIGLAAVPCRHDIGENLLVRKHRECGRVVHELFTRVGEEALAH